MEWQMTTFGELKAGDVYTRHGAEWATSAMKCNSYLDMSMRGELRESVRYRPDLEVYRLVLRSAEREALEKIRPLLQEVVDTYNAPREISQNFDWIEFIERATAALEVKP